VCTITAKVGTNSPLAIRPSPSRSSHARLAPVNTTLEKFGSPGTLVRDYRHWCVLLRQGQVTLGALILGAKGEERAFSELAPEAFAELPRITRDIEHGLKSFRPYDRINYLMLMMVDPHVHFHVLPRYGAAQEFEDMSFADAGWPGPPDLKSATPMPEEIRKRLLHAVQSNWPRT
jgi:diadenosine tetraphosphate (Ap4A) HIT family hydrolase